MRVELLNVPSYRQGTFDNLCAYYTAAMMLSTLFPEYTGSFGEPRTTNTTMNVSNDPIIANYGHKDTRHALAKWFYHGEYIEKATDILNKIMRADGRKAEFECLDETAHDNTFTDVIAGSIEEGLPVMLGWSTPDYGNHAVLVTGYWKGRERWLLINDPAGDANRISWDSLKKQKEENFEVGLCKPGTHDGYRPPKRSEGSGRGSPTKVCRWTPEGYRQVTENYT